MTAGLRALLSEVIDYAGLFPPARLPLETAVANDLRYRQSAEAWMLSRFVCPAGKLDEFGSLLPSDLDSPVRVSAILSPLDQETAGKGDLLAALKHDLESIAACESKFAAVVVDSLEVRIDDSIVHEVAEIRPHLGTQATLFLEVPVLNDLDRLPQVLQEIAQQPGCGFKLRTGGLEAAAFPSVAQLAAVLRGCRQQGVLWKATAGLHHPLPRDDRQIGARMHGFLNLFAAAVLDHVHSLPPAEVEAMLAAENLSAFTCDEEGIAWRGEREYRASVPEIQTARRQALVSFGSCSFDEPREDLTELKLL